MKFVFGLFSFLCEFLLRRRRLRKAREIERGKKRKRDGGRKTEKHANGVKTSLRALFVYEEYREMGQGRPRNKQHDNRIKEKAQRKNV